jgi:hypothetical protein
MASIPDEAFLWQWHTGVHQCDRVVELGNAVFDQTKWNVLEERQQNLCNRNSGGVQRLPENLLSGADGLVEVLLQRKSEGLRNDKVA